MILSFCSKNVCFKSINTVLFGCSQEATTVAITLVAWTRPRTARRSKVTWAAARQGPWRWTRANTSSSKSCMTRCGCSLRTQMTRSWWPISCPRGGCVDRGIASEELDNGLLATTVWFSLSTLCLLWKDKGKTCIQTEEPLGHWNKNQQLEAWLLQGQFLTTRWPPYINTVSRWEEPDTGLDCEPDCRWLSKVSVTLIAQDNDRKSMHCCLHS